MQQLGLSPDYKHSDSRRVVRLDIAGGPDAQPVAKMQSERADVIEHLLEHYGFATNPSRNLLSESPLSYTPLYRSVTLVACSISWLITEGFLSVVTRDGDTVNNRRTRTVLDLMTGLPDGRDPAEYHWKDASVDYAVWGNSLIDVVRDSMYRPIAMNRLEVRGATVTQAPAGARMYTAYRALDEYARVRDYDATDVIHARWPYMGRRNDCMAESPIRVLDRTIRIGIATDRYVQSYFAGDSGAKSKLAIGIKQTLSDKQLDQLRTQITGYTDSREPLVVFGDPSFTHLKESPSDADTSKLREFQVRETGRIYGIPPPLLSENVTSWGSGIAELTKLFYRFGLRDHLGAILSACRAVLLLPRERFRVNEMAFLRGDAKDQAILIRALQGDAQRDQLATETELRQFVGLPKEPDKPLRKAPGKPPASSPPAPPEPTPQPE